MRGFTLLEYVISVSILLITGVMAAGAFVSFNREQVLVTETDKIAMLLAEARAKTLYSQNASQFGVRIVATSTTLFRGNTYNPLDSENVMYVLHSLVTATTSLAGGAVDVVFDRLTGNTSATGTITIMLVLDAPATHVIQVLGTGIAERIK